VKIAVLSDIHANLAALQAVLADIDAVAPDAAIWHTGDIVGYNAEPNEVVALLRERGAVGVMGNHDAAVLGELDVSWFNPEAAAAVRWTATHITHENATWLHALPKISEMGAATLVHASLLKPLEEYVIDAGSARENLFALSTPVLFHGHTHVPAYWALRGGQASLIDIDGRAQPGCSGTAATMALQLVRSAPCSGDELRMTLRERNRWCGQRVCQSASPHVSPKGADHGCAATSTI
jgi:predicted phosphodiesterase